MSNGLPAITTPWHMPKVPKDDLETRAKKELDKLARSIGRAAVNHLKEMYPDALKAVTKTAELSLTNHIRNDVNYHIRPLLMLLIKQGRSNQ
jgi:hypothetical protein